MFVQSDAFTEFRADRLSFIERVFGRNHPHSTEFEKKVKDIGDYYIKNGVGILRVIGRPVGGWRA
jgi:hypothetical protein